MNIRTYSTLPGNIIAYWATPKLVSVFHNGKPLSQVFAPRYGLSTGENDLFLRFWFESSVKDICFDATDYIFAMYTGKKWFPTTKGGEYRKWFGNNDYIVNYQCNGKELQKAKATIRNPNYYFLESLTWTDLTTGNISFRYNKKGFVANVSGPCIFDLKQYHFYLLGLLNSNVTMHILSVTSSTLHFNVGNINDFPFLVDKKSLPIINGLVESNVKIAKAEWDSFENSWGFNEHPLV